MNFEDCKGLGPKRTAALKAAGFETPASLLFFLPCEYIDAAAANSYDDAEKQVLLATPLNIKSYYAPGGKYIVRAELNAGGKTVAAVWFNQRYIKNQLKPDRMYLFYGKYKAGAKPVISAPKIIERTSYRGIIPLYQKIQGVPANVVERLIVELLEKVDFSAFDRLFFGFSSALDLKKCLNALHLPRSLTEAEAAGENLNVLLLSLKIFAFSRIKERNAFKRRFFYSCDAETLNKVIKSLPFELTCSQRQALSEISDDLNRDEPMSRLLQGDVGSGKTVVAFLTMFVAAASGGQAVMMAPTEILARQHYLKAKELFDSGSIETVLLTGSLDKAKRSKVLDDIASGRAKIIIATHAALSRDVGFKSLTLVVIDEQHRFGVGQRSALENKSKGCDVLVMSATPIPRTLALTLYGSLKRSVLTGGPDRSIATKFVPSAKREAMMAYLAGRAEIDCRSYIVCSRIEKDEEFSSVEEVYGYLKKKFPELKVGMVHGRMSDSEKDRAMTAFKNGKSKVLVCTTVVEVGIDVTEATDIVIFDADRYGLSQLHQLRGRVGRGGNEGFCFLLSGNAAAFEERLKFFCHCDNGFELAEYDFQTRGAGDFLGLRQHGNGGSNSKITVETVKRAREIADKWLREGKDLSQAGGDAEFLSKLTLN